MAMSPQSPDVNKTESGPGGGKSQWDRVDEMDEFRLLLLAKRTFVITATITFVRLGVSKTIPSSSDPPLATRTRSPGLVDSIIQA